MYFTVLHCSVLYCTAFRTRRTKFSLGDQSPCDNRTCGSSSVGEGSGVGGGGEQGDTPTPVLQSWPLVAAVLWGQLQREEKGRENQGTIHPGGEYLKTFCLYVMGHSEWLGWQKLLNPLLGIWRLQHFKSVNGHTWSGQQPKHVVSSLESNTCEIVIRLLRRPEKFKIHIVYYALCTLIQNIDTLRFI